MSINTEKVKAAASALEKARSDLKNAKDDYDKVHALNGQTGYSVTVNGVRIDVATMDQYTYMAKMVRGREMIHLGALKALGERIEACKRRVHECECEVRTIVNEVAA